MIEEDQSTESASRRRRPPPALSRTSLQKGNANDARLNDMPILGGERAEQERPSSRRRQSERYRLGEGAHDTHGATHYGASLQRGESPVLANFDVDNRFIRGTASSEYHW